MYLLYVMRNLCQAPIFGDVIKSSGRSLHFTCNDLEQGRQASAELKMPLAIIGLVGLEARVKFKNIDFQTETDFACYCNIYLIKFAVRGCSEYRNLIYVILT